MNGWHRTWPTKWGKWKNYLEKVKSTAQKRRRQNDVDKTTSTKRRQQNDVNKTTSRKRRWQNDVGKTTLAKRRWQNDVGKTPPTKRRPENDVDVSPKTLTIQFLDDLTNFPSLGSDCGSVDRAVASDTRRSAVRIQPSVDFTLPIYCQLQWKDKNKRKEAVIGPFNSKKITLPRLSNQRTCSTASLLICT